MGKVDALAGVNSIYLMLMSKAKTEKTKQKLSNINNACKATYDNGGIVSIPSIVVMLNSSGIAVKKRTFYDKTPGGNLFRELIDAWIKISNLPKINLKKKKKIALDIPILSDDELIKIPDNALRYKVSLLNGSVLGLKNQLNTARSLKELPLLSVSSNRMALEEHTSNDLSLSDYDIEILKDFIKPSPSKKVSFDSDDALIAIKPINRDDSLSQPGLKEAIKKIIKSYTLPEIF